jgi:hypothetical protein
MPRRLVVLTGAGASYDCASELVDKNELMRPPLVKDLFAREFAEILGRYPLAQAAAADIRRAIAPESQNAVPLERHLRERMRDSDDAHTKRRYRQIPLYLQDVLYTVGDTNGGGYTTEPDNYNALVNRALELDDVLFLTLNYDTLLDDRLFIYDSLDSLDAYVSNPKWALVKLHGSVNWGRPIPFLKPEPALAEVDRAMGVGLPIDRFQIINRLIDTPRELLTDEDIELRLQPRLDERRYDDPTVYYPAVSVPVGEQDELVCPLEHLNAAREFLHREDALDLLVIGYSGLDREVLELLRASGKPLRRLLVANGSEPAGLEAGERLQGACGGNGVLEDSVFRGGFTELVRTGKLAEFIASIPA